jgi:hypothetical protein
MGEFGEKMATIPHMFKLLLETGNFPEALAGSNLGADALHGPEM